MDYGARVQSLVVPDREGKGIDVALGYDDLKGYEADDKYFGAIVGRSAGRIAFGDLPIDDERYVLECNEGCGRGRLPRRFEARRDVCALREERVRRFL